MSAAGYAGGAYWKGTRKARLAMGLCWLLVCLFLPSFLLIVVQVWVCSSGRNYQGSAISGTNPVTVSYDNVLRVLVPLSIPKGFLLVFVANMCSSVSDSCVVFPMSSVTISMV